MRQQQKLLMVVFLVAVIVTTPGCKPKVEEKTDDKVTGFYETRKEFKDALAKRKMERDSIAQSIGHLETRKRETVNELKGFGVNTAADALKNEKTQLLAKTLETLVQQTKRLEGDIDRYDKAIIRIEAKLKELEIIELSNDVGLTEEQSLELSRTILDLNEQLGISDSPTLLDELEMEQLLEDEFGTESDEAKPESDEKQDKGD